MAVKTIEEFLKTKDGRVSYWGKWLVWDNGEWLVLERLYKAKHNTCHYQGENLDEALKHLAEES